MKNDVSPQFLGHQLPHRPGSYNTTRHLRTTFNKLRQSYHFNQQEKTKKNCNRLLNLLHNFCGNQHNRYSFTNLKSSTACLQLVFEQPDLKTAQLKAINKLNPEIPKYPNSNTIKIHSNQLKPSVKLMSRKRKMIDLII